MSSGHLSIVPKLDTNLTSLSLEAHDYLLRLELAINQQDGIVDKWDESILQLLDILGELFRVGLRKSLAQSILTSAPSFWQFVREFSAPETAQKIRELPRMYPLFKKSTERENAWTIMTLNHGELGMYISVIRGNRKLVKMFYSESGGSLLLEEEAMDIVEKLIDKLIHTKFNLSIDEYVSFLTERNNAPIPPLVPVVEDGTESRLYNPVPMIKAHMENLENADPDLENADSDLKNTDSDLKDTDSDLENTGLDLEIDKGRPDNDKERPPYVSKFREYFKSELLEEESTREISASTNLSPSHSDSDSDSISTSAELTELPAVVLEGPFGGPVFPKNVAEKNENMHDDPSLAPPMMHPPEFSGGRRELLYSPSSSSSQIDKGTDELHSIIKKPKSPRIIVLDGDGNETRVPAIIYTPSSHGSLNTSINSIPSEYGFFGAPFNVGILSGILYPITGLLTRVGRMAFATLSDVALDDAKSQDSFHTTSLLDSSLRRNFRECPKSDNPEYELRTLPDDGLLAQGNACWDCKTSLTIETSNLCGISGKHFCKECFGKETLESPALIFKDGDFSKRAVSKSVFQEYSRHFPMTLFTLREVDAENLYELLPILKELEELRCKIALAMDHVEFCTSGIYNEILIDFTGSRHLVLTSDLYTINDLIRLHSESSSEKLEQVAETLFTHIKQSCTNCQLGCRYCELCKNGEPIYRFETEKVRECSRCEMLSHVECADHVQGCINCRRVYMSAMSPYIEPAWPVVD